MMLNNLNASTLPLRKLKNKFSPSTVDVNFYDNEHKSLQMKKADIKLIKF
ncbi:hypothetical protein GCM10011501_01080 [Thalassotalea profundi]|uniref:Uncharacterized protein n=1 Tax=Thalassotalea profundi TaxID=2036687 RepID=A0ABQ3IBR6_9GAMM|nr:hypothetical protein GCM10011501_01080 [Thalassotalea profundi]